VEKEITARVFFVWISVFNLFVVSVFWSFMADMFRNEQGKRLFGFIAAGGFPGVLLGPSLTLGLAKPLGAVNLLLISALVLEIAVFCIPAWTKGMPTRPRIRRQKPGPPRHQTWPSGAAFYLGSISFCDRVIFPA